MAEPIKFTNPDVDARYEALISIDKHIQKPGTYNGPLSKITVEMAAGMVERGSNLIKEKAQGKAVEEKKSAKPIDKPVDPPKE